MDKSGKQFYTNLSHQLFVLISFAFVIFEILFLILYSSNFWFSINLLPWGIPAALLSLALAHFALIWVESRFGCEFFRPFYKGEPPVSYRKWIFVSADDEEAALAQDVSNYVSTGFFRYGTKQVLWQAVDQLDLTFWGNLLVKTRSISGPSQIEHKGKETIDANPPYLVGRIPLGVASLTDQKEFIAALQEQNPYCGLNARLLKQIEKKDVPGTKAVLLCVTIFFVFFFLDVGFATFSYLEILKHFYLAEQSARGGNQTDAAKEFATAEHFFREPFVLSWVSRKLIQSDGTKSSIMQMRADTLWQMNKRAEALASMQEALKLSPKNFRVDLKYARMLADAGQEKEALDAITSAVSKNREALVPRLYNVAMLDTKSKPSLAMASKYLDLSLQEFDENVFGPEPNWPPDVSPFLSDVWHRDDVTFVFDRLVKARLNQESNTKDQSEDDKSNSSKNDNATRKNSGKRNHQSKKTK
jgi:tetratricopeptide (TPR) repeat protein